MKNLKHSLPSNLHFYALGIVIVMLVKEETYMLIFLCMYVFMLRKHKQLINIIFVSFLAFCYQHVYKQIEISPRKTFTIVYDDDYKYVIKQGMVHYNLITSDDYKIGDIIKIDDAPIIYDQTVFEGGFNAYDYQRSKGIFGYYDDPVVEMITHGFTFEMIIYNITSYVSLLPDTTEMFVRGLVLGDNVFEDRNLFSNLGIAHLFALSGLHVTLMSQLLDYCLKPVNKSFKLLLYYPLFGFYLFITRFPFSLMRAIFAFLIYETITRFKIPITKLDALSLTFIVLFLINPFMITQLGFILSFIVSLFFVLEKPDEGFIGLVKHTAYIQILIIPIISQFQVEFYPISLIVSPLILMGFTYGILPLSWLSLYLPLGHKLNDGFVLFLTFLKQIEWQQFHIKLPMFDLWQTSLYFMIWLMIYSTKKKMNKIISIMLLIFFTVSIPYLSVLEKTTVTFLDVGQGDTIIINSPKNNCRVVIDAFGDIKTYLRKNHIQRLDYLFITHGDYDHYKASLDVIDTVEVNQIGFNAFETDKLYGLLEPYPVISFKSDDIITCGKLIFNVLGPIKDYKQKNNNSLVMQIDIEGLVYLFTGDIEVEAETDLVQKYGTKLKSDILKVPHHGSDTSSSITFLKHVSPISAIISVGRQNAFLHPHQSVINRYYDLNIKVYQTKLDYTIHLVHQSDRKYVLKVHKKQNM